MKERRKDSPDVRAIERADGWAVVIERFGMVNPVGPRLVRGSADHPMVPGLLDVRPVGMTKSDARDLAREWIRFLAAQEAAEDR